MKELTSRQVGLIIAFAIICLKILFLPALVYKYAGNDSYISYILYALIDFVIGLFVVLFILKYPNFTFYEILEKCFNKFIAKLIFVFLTFYYFTLGVVSLKESHNFFNEILFDFLNWYYFIIPIILILSFIMKRRLRTYGRALELLFWVVLVGVVLTLAVPFKEIDTSELLPFMVNGFGPVLDGMFNMTFAFGDYLLLFVFMGKIKEEKKSAKTILLYAGFAQIFVCLFNVVFICLYGQVSSNAVLAVSDIPQYTSLGRLQWVSIILWTIALVLQISLMFKCCFECVVCIKPLKNKIWYNYGILILIIAVVLLLYLNLALTIKIVTSQAFVIFLLILQLGLPLLIPILCFRLRRKV